MPELLIELFSEEIPARMQARASADLKRLVTAELDKAGLSYGEARAYVTPRRLALVVEDLPDKQPDVTEEKKGPKVGAPEKAIQGFMKANGLDDIAEAETRDSDKGSFYFLVRHVAGRPSKEVLPEVIEGAVRALSWPNSMRWAEHSFRWVRPLHSIIAVFDGEALPGGLDLGGPEGSGSYLHFEHFTQGHRFLSDKMLHIDGFADYRAKLAASYVILDPAERQRRILEQAEALCADAGLELLLDDALLAEVAGLVEWPCVLMGTIDEAYMALPPEVLATSMRSHQKYFSTRTPDGHFGDRFLLASNMDAPVGSELAATIVAGNERVLRARLADAQFFWEQDRKQPLSSRTIELKDIVFHAKLGSLDAKVDRVQALAVEIARHMEGADLDRVRSAARLAKADLVTGMVGEFPELQGLMGRYYALNDGEHTDVADAIRDHYKPLGPSDTCPCAPVSVCVALADKIDTLVGFWAIDEKPTGSKDPFALRRAALGVIRLIVENRLRLPLLPILESAEDSILQSAANAKRASGEWRTVAIGKSLVARPGWDKPISPILLSLLEVVADRLKVTLREQGVRHDLITAVFALGGEDDLVRLLARVEALDAFLASEDGANLLTAYRRAANIVRIEEKKDGRSHGGEAEEALLQAGEEAALYAALTHASHAAEETLAREDYAAAMHGLSGLRRPVDAFFDEVLVNVEEAAVRENRLRLLSQIVGTLDRVADFSQIEGA